MKLKFDFKSIKIKIGLYLILFAIAILFLLWMLQVVFLNNFYRGMKQQNITQGAQKIATIYSKIQGQELLSQMTSIADDSDISVHVIDEDSKHLYNINPIGRDYTTPLRNMPPPDDSPMPQDRQNLRESQNDNLFATLAQQVKNAANKQLLLRYSDGRGRDMMVYCMAIQSPDGKEAILITSSPLQPLDDTMAILGRQYIYVMFIMLVLAFIFSLIIALHVSRPIVRITEKARRLADGDFSMTFEPGEYSEINQLAQTLNYATQGMQQAEKMRNELVANISHDLRTPLTMIRIYAEMIRDIYRDDPESRDQNVAVIMEESDRLTALVQNILDLSRLQAGADTCNRSVFDLTQMIQRILSRFDVFTKKEGYVLDFTQDEPFLVSADEAKIELVLYNLLSNAIHYTGDDKVIHLAIADRGPKIRVLVRDTGSGISPENIDHIWDRYYKEGKEHKRSINGSGLGLAIVKSILELHGTAFGVDSVVNSGSTFWFELEKADQ